MSNEQLREIAAEIWTLVGSAPRAMTLVSIETILRKIRDQVTAEHMVTIRELRAINVKPGISLGYVEELQNELARLKKHVADLETVKYIRVSAKESDAETERRVRRETLTWALHELDDADNDGLMHLAHAAIRRKLEELPRAAEEPNVKTQA